MAADAVANAYPVSNNLSRVCILQRWQACPHEHRQDLRKCNCNQMSNDASQLVPVVIAQAQVLARCAVMLLDLPARLVHSCHSRTMTDRIACNEILHRNIGPIWFIFTEVLYGTELATTHSHPRASLPVEWAKAKGTLAGW